MAPVLAATCQPRLPSQAGAWRALGHAGKRRGASGFADTQARAATFRFAGGALMSRYDGEPQNQTPATLLARFAEQVRHTPQALAVLDQQVRLNYAQLASASERIAS
ncbi:Amino acid adenylation, partial [Pseudomonas coronafaciens pv. garcae]